MQGAAIKDLTDLRRERLERTFNTNIVAMFTLTQVCPPSHRCATNECSATSPPTHTFDYRHDVHSRQEAIGHLDAVAEQLRTSCRGIESPGVRYTIFALQILQVVTLPVVLGNLKP